MEHTIAYMLLRFKKRKYMALSLPTEEVPAVAVLPVAVAPPEAAVTTIMSEGISSGAVDVAAVNLEPVPSVASEVPPRKGRDHD